MNKTPIYFVATESDEQELFAERLKQRSMEFVDSLESVPSDAEIVSIFIDSRIDEAFLASHPKLRLVASRSTGLDHIDEAACQKRQVRVVNAVDHSENAVAEHTFALMLALSRQLFSSAKAIGQGKFSYETIRGFELRGKTLGVLGTGRIGLHVIRIARGFGLHVLAFDAQPKPFYAELLDFSYGSMADILQQSDIVTLHLPLTPETHHLIGRSELQRMKEGALLINTARGGLVDSIALEEALESGHLDGAGLDVLEEERVFRGGAEGVISRQIAERVHQSEGIKDCRSTQERLAELQSLLHNNRLLRRPDVVFTPHTAFNSREAVARICELTAGAIEAFLLSNK